MFKDIKSCKEKAREIRNMILDMCADAGTGHVTSSFSCTEIMVALYYKILKWDNRNPDWEDRDRFVLSKGQASVILYPILADLGFFPKEWLKTFCKKGGKIGVHLQDDIPGVEISAGSLGHGFGIAVGMALAAKMDKKDYFMFALLGDGECYEGTIWESAMFAAHHRLNNLIVIIDRNWQCATDFTENCVQLEPLVEKWMSFGWAVSRVDGHSFEQIFEVLKDFRCNQTNKPWVIIADTVKGKGVDFMEHEVLWHACAPKGDQIKEAKRQLKEVLD